MRHCDMVFPALALATLLAAPAAQAASDIQFTLNNNGAISYTLTSQSDTSVYLGSTPAENPTMNLEVGTRYGITVVNFGPHPLEILAKGASSSSDTILLAQGSGTGSLEGDVGINWFDDGSGLVEFTVTPSLVAAMNTGGEPGYRCGIHVSAMRGDFNTFGDQAAIADPVPDIPQGSIVIDLELMADNLTAPLGVKDPNDGSARLFIYEQDGLVWIHRAGAIEATPFLDVSSRLVTLGIIGGMDEGDYDERGLLCFALHPDFDTNGLVYTYTSEPVTGAADFTVSVPGSHNHQSVIAEWQVDGGDPDVIDPSTRRELLRIDQPQFNHNGGDIAFGPDGMLYVSLGDGGSADDQGDGHSPFGNGQDTSNILGSVLRIDPAGSNSTNGEYGIPADNPFVGSAPLDEIYAYGFRNPYRLSFSGSDLYVADVGQNDVEEVNLVSSGENYGWPAKEGSFFFDPADGATDGTVVDAPAVPLPPEPLVDPIANYDHDDGITVLGGYVYGAGEIAGLDGLYVFGDFSQGFGSPAGRLFYLDGSNAIRELQLRSTDDPLAEFVKGFGSDAAGNVYLCSSTALGPYGTSGAVYRLVAPAPSDVSGWVMYD